MSWQRNGLLLVLLVYMIGPNPNLGGAQVGDAILALYIMAYMVSSRVSIRPSLLGFFAWPAFVVALSLAGKVLSGFAVGSDELNNVLKTASLSVLGVVGASFGARAVAEQDYTLPQRLSWLAIIAVAFAGLLGILQYARPGLFAELAHGLYERQLIINISNVQQAELANRISSIFTWANAFGMFIVFGTVVALSNARNLPPWVVAAVLLLGGIGVLLANSRASMLLLGLAGVYAAIVLRRWRVLGLAVLGVALAAVFVRPESLLGSSNVARLRELVDFFRTGSLPQTLAVRTAVLTYLPGLLAHSQYVYFGYPMAVYQRNVFLSADNQYLGFFLKYGLCAVMLVGWQWFYTAVAAARCRRAGPNAPEKPYLHAVLLLNVIIALGALSQDTLFLERWREFFFAFSGVVLGMALARQDATVGVVQSREGRLAVG